MSGWAGRCLFSQEPLPSWEFFTSFPRLTLKRGSSAEDYRFFWARNAIYHALGALRISPKAHILLPAYLCKAAVEPFRAYGSEIEFYNVGRDCRPDFAEVESRIGPRTEAVMAVHYFGFPQEIRKFRKLSDRHNLALIEDCAHVLEDETGAICWGENGDAAVFSWRKFLPVYDGGDLRLRRADSIVQVNWQEERTAFTLKIAKNLADRVLVDSQHPFARAVARILESAKRAGAHLRKTATNDPIAALDSNSPLFDFALVSQPMSRVSRWLFRHSKIDAVIRRRRENYLHLQHAFESVEGLTPLHADLPPGVCPWVFPVFFDDLPNAHLHLRGQGIPATAWDFVKPEMLDLRAFPDADFLYENLAFLPVHQNLTLNSLDLIIAAVRKVRQTAKVSCHQKAYLAG